MIKRFFSVFLMVAVILFSYSNSPIAATSTNEGILSETSEETESSKTETSEEKEWFRIRTEINYVPFTPDDFSGEYIDVEYVYTTPEGTEVVKSASVGLYPSDTIFNLYDDVFWIHSHYSEEDNHWMKIGEYCVKRVEYYFLDRMSENIMQRISLNDLPIPENANEGEFLWKIANKAMLHIGTLLVSIDLADEQKFILTDQMLDVKEEGGMVFFTTLNHEEFKFDPKDNTVSKTGKTVIQYPYWNQNINYMEIDDAIIQELREKVQNENEDFLEEENFYIRRGDIFEGKYSYWEEEKLVGNINIVPTRETKQTSSIATDKCWMLDYEGNLSVWNYGKKIRQMKLPEGDWVILSSSVNEYGDRHVIMLEQTHMNLYWMEDRNNFSNTDPTRAQLIKIGEDVVDIKILYNDLVFMEKDANVYYISDWDESAEKVLVGAEAIGIYKTDMNLGYIVTKESKYDSIANGYPVVWVIYKP